MFSRSSLHLCTSMMRATTRASESPSLLGRFDKRCTCFTENVRDRYREREREREREKDIPIYSNWLTSAAHWRFPFYLPRTERTWYPKQFYFRGHLRRHRLERARERVRVSVVRREWSEPVRVQTRSRMMSIIYIRLGACVSCAATTRANFSFTNLKTAATVFSCPTDFF